VPRVLVNSPAGAQADNVDDFGGIEEILIGYLTARDDESRAKDRKDFYRQFITGNRSGTYGRARFRFSKPSQTVDKHACATIVEGAGVTLPMKTTEGRLTVALVPPDQTRGATQ
jgi:hypothetical protein